MIKLKDIINEIFAKSFETDYGKGPMYVEVYKNPSIEELKKCKPHYEIGALLDGNDIYTWDRGKAYHKNVMKQLGLMNSLSIMIIPDLTNSNRVDVLVTDATRDTRWHHNPKTKQFIERHPFFKYKKIDNISYWDEDIVGDWSLLKQ